VEIMMGTGTLANDVVGYQISLLPDQGLILGNGEFGDRLMGQARRLGLSFKSFRRPWGSEFEPQALEQVLGQNPDIGWIWFAHCETSTGTVNDVELVKEICSRREIKICLDCVSSVGTVPVDLRGVYLASTVSGKGIGSIPGLSMVFYHHSLESQPESIPTYLDLGFYSEKNGIPFTISSVLIFALHAALRRFESDSIFKDIAVKGSALRTRLQQLGLKVVAGDSHSNPAVTTIALPSEVSSKKLALNLEKDGFRISYNSNYLVRRNWIQICLMSDLALEMLDPLLDALKSNLRLVK